MLKVGIVLSVCMFSFVSSARVKSYCERTPVPEDLLKHNQVNVVYTMESSCDMCVQQAARLPRLKRYLEKKGIKTHFIIGVNSETDRLSGLVPHIPVNNRQIWRSLGETNNHFYVIDRCGRMVYEIINPWSNLNLTFVRSAIVTTQFSHRCGLCPQDYNPVPQKEEIPEYPEHTKSNEHIAKDSFPFKIVVKLRHRHKGSSRIYSHAVSIPEIPKYHGHIAENIYSIGGYDKRHSQSSDSGESAAKEKESDIHNHKDSAVDSSSSKNASSSEELGDNENSTISIIKEESTTSNKLLEEKLTQINVRNSELSSKTNGETQVPETLNENKEKGFKSSEGNPLNSRKSDLHDKAREVDQVKGHYKHILHWTHYTNDYD